MNHAYGSRMALAEQWIPCCAAWLSSQQTIALYEQEGVSPWPILRSQWLRETSLRIFESLQHDAKAQNISTRCELASASGMHQEVLAATLRIL